MNVVVVAYMQIRPQQTLEWNVPNEPATFYFDNFEIGNVARPNYKSNLDDVSDVVKSAIKFIPVSSMDEVLKIALGKKKKAGSFKIPKEKE